MRDGNDRGHRASRPILAPKVKFGGMEIAGGRIHAQRVTAPVDETRLDALIEAE